MDTAKCAELARIAAWLAEFREAAIALDEPFLAYLIELARVEAEKPRG